MKLFPILVMLILSSSIVAAATIQGTIYDFSLNKVKNAVIEINTQPAQRIFTPDGSYSAEVPIGDYKITAKTPSNKVIAEEEIKVKNEGTFNLDLFVFPNLDEEDQLEGLELEPLDLKEKTSYKIPIIILIIIILMFIIYKRKKKKELHNKQIEEPKQEQENKEILSDDLPNKVLEIIKKEKRITQKDLRKQFPLSEAKISLVITELEAKGKIEKIKMGRGNILIIKH